MKIRDNVELKVLNESGTSLENYSLNHSENFSIASKSRQQIPPNDEIEYDGDADQ